MEHIIVQVADKVKAQMLKEFLAALDFVYSIDTIHQEAEAGSVVELETTDDFFALAGLWENRDVEFATLRQQAWSRNQ